MHHDFLSTYAIKTAEYLIAISFLVLFVPFWRFVNGGRAALHPVQAASRALQSAAEFLVPDGIFLHPGHAWARLVEPRLAVVGMDDFAHKLLGAINTIDLPAVGARVGQGEKVLSLRVGDRTVDMLSPIDGRVVAVNEAVAKSPAALKSDPYGTGWLFKVEPERPEANSRQLLSGAAARRWMSQVWDDLRARMAPELGLVAQDGGTPVDGIAPNMDPDRWDQIARSFFLT